MLDPPLHSSLVSIPDPSLQCLHPTIQIQSKSHIQCCGLVWPNHSVLQPMSRLYPGLYLPVPPIHRPILCHIQLFYPARYILTFEAWNRRHRLYIRPVPSVHLISFYSTHFQLLGTSCPYTISFVQTYSVDIRFKTNKKCLHAQIPSQEYQYDIPS